MFLFMVMSGAVLYGTLASPEKLGPLEPTFLAWQNWILLGFLLSFVFFWGNVIQVGWETASGKVKATKKPHALVEHLRGLDEDEKNILRPCIAGKTKTITLNVIALPTLERLSAQGVIENVRKLPQLHGRFGANITDEAFKKLAEHPEYLK